MNLVISRDELTDVSTSGELFIDKSSYPECYTLELPSVDGLPGSAIPQGLYHVELNYSPKFSSDPQFVALCAKLGVPPLMPEILGIPGRSEIRIHWGNTPRDTEGCILVGDIRMQDMVGESRTAFAAFYAKLLIGQRQGMITLQVVGGARLPQPVNAVLDASDN